MLLEYRDEIRDLKMSNAHFTKIFEKHNELDQTITDVNEERLNISDTEVEVLKKEKLLLKDEILMMILQYRKSKQ